MREPKEDGLLMLIIWSDATWLDGVRHHSVPAVTASFGDSHFLMVLKAVQVHSGFLSHRSSFAHGMLWHAHLAVHRSHVRSTSQ